MAARVVQSPLVNPFDSDEEEVAPPVTIKPKKKTQFAATTTTTTTTIATNPFSDEDEEDRVLHPHSSGTNAFDHDDQGPISSNMPKGTLRPCKSMAVNYNAAKGGKPESKLTKHMSLSSSAYTPFGKATSLAATTTASSGEAPCFPPVFNNKSTFGTSDFRHLFGHKDTSGDHGTRRKEVMGAEDAGTESTRKTSSDLFGHDDADSDECNECRGKKVTSKGLFGSEDVGYETGKNGRNLVGDEDGVVNSTSRELFGSGEGEDGTKSRKAREVFGDYDGEEEDHDEYAPTAPSVDEFVNKAVADLQGLTLTQATTTTLVTKTVEVAEAK